MSGPEKPRRGRRLLAPSERQLWDRVAKTTVAMPGGDAGTPSHTQPDLPDLSEIEIPDTPDLPLGRAPRIPEDLAIRAGLRKAPVKPKGPAEPRITLSLQPPDVRPVGRPEAGLDKRTAERLRRGEREPDARIDLHGMTAERAHRSCLRFLSEALGRGARVVLVITGKGKTRDRDSVMPEGRGVLRTQLPGWLRASPLGHAIVGIYEAHQRHGGSGAFYVYLKRRR